MPASESCERRFQRAMPARQGQGRRKLDRECRGADERVAEDTVLPQQVAAAKADEPGFFERAVAERVGAGMQGQSPRGECAPGAACAEPERKIHVLAVG